ncbi:carbohydrate sulfotransferase 5-like [Rhipicephalus microplus]|uniref:carbohydrate sulfotransferase 5-like n=1 Tax=Rhipicephalus microplus TaxID=6941 RepID=UPI003F6B7076
MTSKYSQVRAKAWIRLLWLLAGILLGTMVYLFGYEPKYGSSYPSRNSRVHTITEVATLDGHHLHQPTEEEEIKYVPTPIDVFTSPTPPSKKPDRVTKVTLGHSSVIVTTMPSKIVESNTTTATPISANVTATHLLKHLSRHSAHDHSNTTSLSTASWNKTNTSFHNNITKSVKAMLLKQFVNTYPQQKPSKVHRILEVAYFRSGSSFLGQLLSANPRTFYHFEPLMTLPIGNRLYGEQVPRGLDYITDFFNCDFTNHSDHLRRGMQNLHPFKQNTYLWSVCKGVKRVCLDPEFLNAVCKVAAMQVMKVVRIGMAAIRHYLLDGPMATTKKLKVVHLVRDPRAIWLSRRRRKWCRGNCSRAIALCNDMKRDLDVFENISREFPGRAIQVRFEDLALDTLNVTLKMYSALGLPLTTSVRQFIDTHTKETNVKVQRYPYATFRNSKSVANAWKRKIRPEHTLHLNRVCGDVIRRLGYEL